MTIDDFVKDIDFTDADILERIEIGSKKVYEETEKIKKEREEKKEKYQLAEGIRQECKILKDFLDYAFGEGTSKKLFGEKNSLQLCLKAFEGIIIKREKQIKEIDELASKYSPERVQR